MSGRQVQHPLPTYRTDRAEELLERLGNIESGLVAATIELRVQGCDQLADSLNAEISHLRQVRIAAEGQLRMGARV